MLHGCPSIDQWHRDVPTGVRSPLVLGLAVLAAGALGFGLWAATAPLASAVVASGSFVATGQNKQVQHFEGGIIQRVLVHEGDLVQADQPLLVLDSTAANAKLRRLTLRRYRLLATKARLQAQISSRDQLDWSGFGREVDDPVIKALIRSEETHLAAWHQNVRGQEEVLRREIAGLQESIRGYRAQVESNELRRSLFQQELQGKRSLADKQLIRQSEILILERSEAGLSGEYGELQGRIGDANERISRAEQQISQLRYAATQKSIEELQSAESEIDDLHEQILAARDVVQRTEVRAPVRGIVVRINQQTAGGVVAPGATMLELLPVNDALIIEARLNPNDISHVKVGQDALVRITALNRRIVPMIDGKVTYVSADTVAEAAGGKVPEEASKRDTFIVRIRLDETDLGAKLDNFQPVPGMPAEVYVQTGTRTFFTYLMRPLLDSFARAFREH